MVTGIIYALVFLIVAIAIAAGIIMLAARLVAGFTPKFMLAVVTAIVEFIAGAVVSWILRMILGAGGLGSIVTLVVVFLVYAAIFNALVKKGGAPVGFGKSCLVTLVQLIIEIILGIIIVFVFGAAVFGMLGGMAAMH